MPFCTPGSRSVSHSFESPGDLVKVLGAGAPDAVFPGGSGPQASVRGLFLRVTDLRSPSPSPLCRDPVVAEQPEQQG